MFQQEHKANLGRKPWNKGKHISKEAKKKLSEAHKGHKHSEETKEKISKALVGRSSGMLGKYHSKETKQKMSNIHKGSKNPNWKGGQYQRPDGRVFIKVYEHPRAHNGYVMRSHLTIEKILGRYLTSKEVVHHINGIKNDDRPENLQLFPNRGSHTSFHNKTKCQ